MKTKQHDVTVDRHFLEAVGKSAVVMELAAKYLLEPDGVDPTVIAEDLKTYAQGLRIGLEYNEVI